MCETCYVGDKLCGLLETDKSPCVRIEVMDSHFSAAEAGLGRELGT